MKTGVLNFRLEPDMEPLIDAWLAKNPGFTASQLGNLALRALRQETLLVQAHYGNGRP